MVKTRLSVLGEHGSLPEAEATCSSAVKSAFDLRSPCIVVLTKTGFAASNISKYRPEAPIFMASTQERPVRQANYLRGVVPVLVDAGKTVDERIKMMQDKADGMGLLMNGDVIVCVHG